MSFGATLAAVAAGLWLLVQLCDVWCYTVPLARLMQPTAPTVTRCARGRFANRSP